MRFGYLITVSTTDQYDYLGMAYALALSIKNTQKEGYDGVALVIDDKEKLKSLASPWVFDHVIEWNQETFWNGRAWMDQHTPFEYTVGLDADMLFLRDYSEWIDFLIEHYELYLPSDVYTFQDELITSDYYRKTFTENDLPNLYSMYTFFKKNSDTAAEFFAVSRYITKYPNEFSNMFLTKHKPAIVGTDEAFALSAKILGIEDQITANYDALHVVHFKPKLQNWPVDLDSWKGYIGFYLDKQGNLKIGNIYQNNIVHYVEKHIMTPATIRILEEIAWKN